MRLAPLFVALLALTGCGAVRPPGADVHARQGRTPAVAAQALVRTTPTHGDSQQVTVSAWQGASGIVRLLITKADVDVLAVRLDPEGHLQVWSPRQRECCTTRLDDPALPDLAPYLPLLMRELTDGPLPPDAQPTAAGLWTVTEAGLTITVACAGDAPRAKTVSGPDGEVLVRLAYGDLKPFDTLLRPARLTATTADGEALVILRRCDAMGDVSAERLHLQVPDDATVVPLATLLDHLNR